MDALVVTVVSFLAKTAAARAAGEAGKEAWDALKRLSAGVHEKLAGDTEAEIALGKVERGDEEGIGVLAERLQVAVAADRVFRQSLEALLDDTRSRHSVTITTHISGNAMVGKSITLHDVHGDLTL